MPSDPAFPDPHDRLEIEPGCDRCPALAEGRERISWGVGPEDAAVLVVGEAPGVGDPDADRWQGGNWTGMAYTSRHSGRRIRRLMAAAGVAGECFYTNAVKCLPLEAAGTAREPTADERAACGTHLQCELETVAPAVVVPTGRHATASVFALDGRELDGFLETVLEPRRLDAIEPPVLPLLHPSYRDVWASRLGYSNEEYEAAVRTRLRDLLGRG